ncbi:hypothetical protein DM01DRAFT_22692 [Hesseltinella vesiculosa]|uniref:Uncharacterized protein n=1 Tax=Hesseltinella vesiculosa TaxID=101127 RepID=A0A1X2GDE5_9FUNG|nr:hypothetical protein DM01DRAFT_22692 [Hesseltinella vesiculosa]
MSSSFYSFVQSLTNSITSKYEIQGQISTCGLWKIYHGTHRTTQQPVAVFVFEKKSLDISFKRERGASKQDTEQVYELLKKEALSLFYALGKQLGKASSSIHFASCRTRV